MAETFLYILSILLKVGIIPVALLIYKKKLTFLQGLFTGAFLFLASFGCEVYYLNMSNGYSFIDSVVNTVFDTLKANLASDTGIPEESYAAVGAAVESVRNMYFAIFPSLMVCMNLISSYFWLMVSKGIFAVCKRDVSGFSRFCDFRMSRMGVVAGIISLVIYTTMASSRVSLAFLNIAMIMLFASFVCGFSLADFKLRTRIKSSVLRFFIYLALSAFVFGFGMWLFVVLGAMDAFVNMRAPRHKPDDFDEQ